MRDLSPKKTISTSINQCADDSGSYENNESPEMMIMNTPSPKPSNFMKVSSNSNSKGFHQPNSIWKKVYQKGLDKGLEQHEILRKESYNDGYNSGMTDGKSVLKDEIEKVNHELSLKFRADSEELRNTITTNKDNDLNELRFKLKHESERFKKNLSDKDHEIHELKAKLKYELEHSERLQKNINNRDHEINQLNSQFKEDSEKLRKTMNNKDDDINELRSQLNHDIEQLQKSINKKDHDINELKSKNKLQKSELDKFIKLENKLKSDYDIKKISETKLQNELILQSNEFNQFKLEYNKLKDSLENNKKSSQNEYEQLLKTIDKKDNDINDLRNNIDQINLEYNQMIDNNKKVSQNDLQQLKLQLDNTKNEYEQLNIHYQNLQFENKNLNDLKLRQENDINIMYEQTIHEKNDEILQLKLESNDLQEDHKIQLSNISDKTIQLDVERARLEAEIFTYKNEIINLEKNNTSYKKVIDDQKVMINRIVAQEEHSSLIKPSTPSTPPITANMDERSLDSSNMSILSNDYSITDRNIINIDGINISTTTINNTNEDNINVGTSVIYLQKRDNNGRKVTEALPAIIKKVSRTLALKIPKNIQQGDNIYIETANGQVAVEFYPGARISIGELLLAIPKTAIPGKTIVWDDIDCGIKRYEIQLVNSERILQVRAKHLRIPINQIQNQKQKVHFSSINN